MAYLNQIGLFPVIDSLYGWIRKSKKGKPVIEIVKQEPCLFADGTSRHITCFDELANDEGYKPTRSTCFLLTQSNVFSKPFPAFEFTDRSKLFIWRLHIEKPAVIDPGIDTMVMEGVAKK